MKTKTGWETSHPPPLKNLHKVKWSKKCVQPTLAINTELTLKYYKLLSQLSKKRKSVSSLKINTGFRRKQDLSKNSSPSKSGYFTRASLSFSFFLKISQYMIERFMKYVWTRRKWRTRNNINLKIFLSDKYLKTL